MAGKHILDKRPDFGVSRKAMFYVATSSLLAVVETDEGWAILFDDGRSVPNMTKECAKEIIQHMNAPKSLSGEILKSRLALSPQEVPLSQ